MDAVNHPLEEFPAAILELLKGHGVGCDWDGEWILIQGGRCRLRATSRAVSGSHQLCAEQFDVCFVPWPGSWIIETFAGIGETYRERMNEALKSFADNTLHVLLRVFCGVSSEGQTYVYEAENSGVNRRITLGNIVRRGAEPSAPSDELWQTLQSALMTVPIPEGTHWVRLFRAQMRGQLVGFELLFDNEPWKDVESAVRGIPFPSSEGFVSERLFCAIEGGLDIHRILGVISQHPAETDDQLEERIMVTGASQAEARRILLMAPMPFGAKIIKKLGLAVSTTVMVNDGSSTHKANLMHSKVFCELLRISESAMEVGTMTSEEFLAVAGRDANFNAVNNAMLAGASLKGGKLADLTVFWNESSPFIETQQSTCHPRNTPWWQFWKS